MNAVDRQTDKKKDPLNTCSTYTLNTSITASLELQYIMLQSIHNISHHYTLIPNISF